MASRTVILWSAEESCFDHPESDLNRSGFGTPDPSADLRVTARPFVRSNTLLFLLGIPLTTAPLHRLSLIARQASRLVPEPGAAPVQGQRGTDQPVDELLASHAEAVYRYALRLTRDRIAAQDLAQETLLRGWQARSKLREPAAARVWLLRIATNLHRDNWRSRRPTEPLMLDPVDIRPHETERIDESEEVERALAALDELSPRQRQAMHLITIEQLAHKDAAEVMGITVDALKANLSLGRRRMRDLLKDIYEQSRSVRARES